MLIFKEFFCLESSFNDAFTLFLIWVFIQVFQWVLIQKMPLFSADFLLKKEALLAPKCFNDWLAFSS